MNFVKSIWSFVKGFVKTAFDFVVGPFIALKDIPSMSVGANIINVIQVIARVIVGASYFYAVPAWLVTLAWICIIGIPVLVLLAIIAMAIIGGFSLKAIYDKTHAEVLAEEAEAALDTAADAVEKAVAAEEVAAGAAA